MRLKLRPETINELSSPSFIARRQQHINFTVRTAMEFTPIGENESAGLVMLQNNNFHLRMEYTLKEGRKVLQFTKRFNGKEEVLAEKFVDAKRLYLKIETYGQDYSFYYTEHLEDWKELIENVDGRLLSRELAGGFTGAYVGMYATSKGKMSENVVDFDWFEYSGI